MGRGGGAQDLADLFPASDWVLCQTATAQYNLRNFDMAQALFEELRQRDPHRIEVLPPLTPLPPLPPALALHLGPPPPVPLVPRPLLLECSGSRSCCCRCCGRLVKFRALSCLRLKA